MGTSLNVTMSMFLIETEKLKARTRRDPFFVFLLAFCLLLPFQFALNPTAGIDLAVVRVIIPTIFLVWIFFKLKNKERIFKTNKLTILLAVFLFFMVFSIFFSSNFSWSIRKLLFTLTIAPIYLLSISIANTYIKKRAIITALVIGAAVLSWVAIAQFLGQFIFGIDAVYSFLASNITPFFLGKSFADTVATYPSWLVNASGTTYMRAVGLFPDPHMLSYFVGMLIPWSIALLATTKKYKLLFFISTVSLVAADIMSFTRGGYIALIAGSLVIIPLVSKKTVLKILIGALVLVGLFMIAPHSPVAGRLTSSFDAQEGSNQARLSNWQQAINIIAAHPFGVGVGSYSLAVNPAATYREPIYAHNAYLDIAAELGIHSTIIFVTIIFIVLVNFWKLSKTNSFFIAGVSSITLFATHSLVENPLYSVHVLPLLLIIIALSIPNKQHEEISSNK